MSDHSAAAFIKQLDKVYRLRTPMGYLRLVYMYGNTVEAYLACHDRKDKIDGMLTGAGEVYLIRKPEKYWS